MAEEVVVPACPGPALEIAESMPQPEREVRGLRNDLRVLCEVAASEGVASAAAVAGLRSDLDQLVSGQAQVLARLGVEGGLPVKVAGQVGALETVASAPSEAASASNFEALEATVLSDAETTNSDLWGIAGLFVGFLTLASLYKVVRP